MSHVALVGDSIFDNGAYVAGGPDVIRQLRARLPSGWRATLGAVDGSVSSDVGSQLARLPRDVTHLVVSAGGNDALGHLGILEESARSAAEVLGRLSEIREDFHRQYARMLEGMLALEKPTVLCTIYDPCFPDLRTQRSATAALTLFNDVITRLAGQCRVPLIDLRVLFDDPACYANPIEPSVIGGEKLAEVICRILTQHEFRAGHAVVYT